MFGLKFIRKGLKNHKKTKNESLNGKNRSWYLKSATFWSGTRNYFPAFLAMGYIYEFHWRSGVNCSPKRRSKQEGLGEYSVHCDSRKFSICLVMMNITNQSPLYWTEIGKITHQALVISIFGGSLTNYDIVRIYIH